MFLFEKKTSTRHIQHDRKKGNKGEGWGRNKDLKEKKGKEEIKF